MSRKLARTLTGVVILVAAAIGSSGPALASSRIYPNSELVETYYNNAQHSQVVGQRWIGECEASGGWGTETSYVVGTSYFCN
jgi:hypothetical protein